MVHDAQHGFVPKRSCVSQLLCALNDWTQALEGGDPVDVCYLDFQKAFDSVPHRRLLRKIYDLGIRGSTLGWIEAFLSRRRQRVVIRGEKSEWAPVLSGVPQGSVLGPTLFLAFVNDMPKTTRSDIKLFADDAKVYANVKDQDGQQKLQDDLISHGAWSEKWLMPFNVSKCSTLHLGTANRRDQYLLLGTPLEQVQEEKDLGVFVDEHLKFRRQAASAVSKSNQIVGAIRRSFEHLDKQTLPLLYKTLVRPVLEYGNAVWGPYNVEDQKLVERVQRRATKLVGEIRGLPYGERLKILKLPSLQYRRRRGDIILMHQLTHGRLDIQREQFFQNPATATTRGHSLKVGKPQAQSRVRRNHWCIRVVNDWNSLPESVVSAETTNMLKSRLDDHWKHMWYDFKE